LPLADRWNEIYKSSSNHPVQILRKTGRISCATLQCPEEISLVVRCSALVGGAFSAKFSFASAGRAQRNSYRDTVSEGFPHFHSDGYYYYLYTCIKTGYSSLSQKQSSNCLPAEEIQQWNSV
jgi:hypothetical protein